MANENAVQPREPRWLIWVSLGSCFLALLAVLAFYVSILLGPAGFDPDNPWIQLSAIPIIGLPFWALWLQAAKRTKTMTTGISDRAMYSVLCILFLFHAAIAFHVGHGWSHRDAFERTERISGFGPGIYVSYLFVAVWVADAIWSWVAFDSYLNRPKWLSWAIVGFMGFVWFNAVIVFGSWLFRGIVVFLLLMHALQIWYARYLIRGYMKGKASERARQ